MISTVTVEGSFNVRAFGERGAPWLLRSAALDAITPTGADMLNALGVRLILDLREDAEREDADEVAANHGIPVRTVPLYQLPAGPPLVGTLEQVYEMLLRTRGAQLAEAVGAIAEEPGAVLVHCTAGKDRTGLVIALALLATGTPTGEVIADYISSEKSVSVNRHAAVEATLTALQLDADALQAARRLHLQSPAEALEHALDVLDELGGVQSYLMQNGLSAPQLAALGERPRSAAA